MWTNQTLEEAMDVAKNGTFFKECKQIMEHSFEFFF
jgi:hypothetical protein